MKHKILTTTILTLIIFQFLINAMCAQNPNWTSPNSANFAYTANVIAILNVDDVKSNNINDRIAFFVGNEIRGLSKPIAVGNGHYTHFITLYSNTAIQEMTIKVYQHSTTTVYSIAADFRFTTQGNTGSVDAPFAINAYEGNIAPISILPIPNQSILYGIPYAPIRLNEYVLWPDTTEITWTFTPNPFLSVTLTNGIIQVVGEEDLEGQQTTLSIIATDTNGQTLLVPIVFALVEDFLGPVWGIIPSQSIVHPDTFEVFQLDSFENTYSGQHLEFDYVPIVEEAMDTVTNPNWFHNSKYKNTMSITVRVQYTPKYIFAHEDDVLVAMINGVIRGLAYKDEESGLYYMTIGGSVNGAQIKFKFYSGLQKQILNWTDSLTYRPYGILGNPDMPFAMDFSPLLPMILSNGETSIAIIDTTWRGLMTFEFKAFDSIYGAYKFDHKQASFCIVDTVAELTTLYQDADGDGLGNPNVSILSCSGSEGYVTNDDDCDDTSAVDPLLIVTIAETSGNADNDGYVCNGATVTLNASGGVSYLWSNGATTATIMVTPASSATFRVTMTNALGCPSTKATFIGVEGTVVRQSGNDGFNSLRQVVNCIANEGTITFDQPLTNIANLTSSIIFEKNVIIKGQGINARPIINIDFLNTTNGLRISQFKVLTLDNVDIKITNNTSSKPTVSGKGILSVKNRTVVFD